jgi:GT2 family glycosyltransferase
VSDAVPLASVVVVCWNSADVLGRCLEQLLEQDYPNYEILVVDDGSQDDTVGVAERALGSGRLTIVRSPLNRGCPHARNLGLLHAKGDVIAFIDADGFASPGWLGHLVAAFEADATVGGIASTVFMAANPLVLNGAGGTVNRQGWAADVCMNVPYDRAEIPTEALYPMGCGMALRRTAAERVGPFDDRMLNYYDDVDYGIRLWRAGYRVIVAPDAWIDHGFGHSGGDSPHKQLLCEQHRMRVVLTHSSLRTLARWMVHEALATHRSFWPRRGLKMKAISWNVRQLPNTLARRWKLRGAPRPPERLVDPSWGEDFPKGVPPLLRPVAEAATHVVDMSDAAVVDRLLYGWFPPEQIAGRSYGWAGVQAAALISLSAPATRLRLEYAHVPEDNGGVEVAVRSVGSRDPLAPAFSTHLRWRYVEHCVENHPLRLPVGDYEVLFRADSGWSNPPAETRSLAFALAEMRFEAESEIDPGGLDMGSPHVGEQLVSGWFEPEQGPDGAYRWAAANAAAIVRVDDDALMMRMRYCLPPGRTRGLRVSIREVARGLEVWATHIAYLDGAWREEQFAVALSPGEYLVRFDAETTWSNPGGADEDFWPENRSLGFALASVEFEGASPGEEP